MSPARRRRAGRAPLPLVLAWRFLRGRRSRLLASTGSSAVAATGIGVAAMVIAMALMTGYREDLERKLLGGNAAIVAYPLGAGVPPPAAAALAELAVIPGVTHVGRVAYAQGTLAAGAGEAGSPREAEVTLRGVEPGAALPGGLVADLAAGADGIAGVAVGEDLAASLRLAPGDRVRLLALGFAEGAPRFRFLTLRVAAVFRSGLAQFDAAWAVADRELVERLSGLAAASSLVELGVADPGETAPIAAAVRRRLGPDWLVSDWQDLNRELFTALKIQQVALFLVLGLIVLVSTFNVASTLVVLVRERMRAVGVLAALGLPAAALRATFLLYGGALGIAGTAMGIAVGAGTAWTLTRFELIRFDAEVAAIYFLRSVPFRVRALDLAGVAAFTLAVTAAACWLPARRAARVEPAAALRYE